METKEALAGSFFRAEREENTMQPTMLPLLILNILENHATKERPLTITEITDWINREFAPFAAEKEHLINRTTVMRILDTMEFWTDGKLFNFRVVCTENGTKRFCLEK